MPGMYRLDEYDIAGFCVGVVERSNIIDGSKIKAGNVVIGLESSGIHSNGYSLVRRVFSESELKRMNKELLSPTRIYVKQVLSLLPNSNIKGIAHITGGAFYDKISRILPDNIDVRINKNSWVVPKLFRLIQSKGNIIEKEMYHTLNMGIGMVLIVEAAAVESLMQRLGAMKLKSWIIGETLKGRKQVRIV
jgi:phosphoribosylformylglycinamidine cyclo-ligase